MSDDPTATALWGFLWMIVWFVLNVLVSFAHLALVACNDAQLAKAAEDGDKRAARAQKLMERSVPFTERVRLCNVLFGFGFCAAAFWTVYRPFGAWLGGLMPQVSAGIPAMIAAVLTVLAATVVWLLFCERLPRRMVQVKAQNIAAGMSGFLGLMLAIVTPLDVVLYGIANGVSRVFGADPTAIDGEVTEEEILMLVDVGEEKGVIEGSQKEMINNIFEFDDLIASDIMTPRTDVEAIEADDTIDDALKAAVDNGVSRLPVYEEDIDHVVGVLFIKDLLPYVGKALPDVVTVRSLMREPLFVPETKKCGELFSEMTALHVQMAMVVDEYGGIAGIVTVEDLLESIVGNMQDEYDNEQEEVTQIDDNRYEVDGTTDIDEVAELLRLEIPEGDYETLGGFLTSKLGRIPDADEHPVVTFENAEFTVMSMEDRRIALVHIELKPAEPDEEPPKEKTSTKTAKKEKE